MAKTKEPKIVTTHQKQWLRCKLTKEEREKAVTKLVDALDALHKVVDEREAVTKQMKARESQLEADINVTQILVKDNSELRNVDVTLTLDYTTLRAKATRDDTGEVVEDRKMNDEEKQLKMDFDKSEKTPETEAA
jgi:hypothetical protein